MPVHQNDPDPDGILIIEYRWSLDNASTINGVTAVLEVAQSSGEIPITLTVIDNQGAIAIKQQIITLGATCAGGPLFELVTFTGPTNTIPLAKDQNYELVGGIYTGADATAFAKLRCMSIL